jgi:transposase
MSEALPFSQFISHYPDEETCFNEILRYKYPKGFFCTTCKHVTTHYRLASRPAFTCKYCRSQIYPLAGTIFEKSSTPLRIWFYALFLMTHTKSQLTIKQLQNELGVTYKTAWRIYTLTKKLMAQNNADLLTGEIKLVDDNKTKKDTIHKWVFFNKIEFKVVQRKEGGG